MTNQKDRQDVEPQAEESTAEETATEEESSLAGLPTKTHRTCRHD